MASFFILTASEMQIDFASDRFFSFCFGGEFHFVTPAHVFRPMNAFEMSLGREENLI